jgi:hypothetical protein
MPGFRRSIVMLTSCKVTPEKSLQHDSTLQASISHLDRWTAPSVSFQNMHEDSDWADYI